MPYTLAGVFPMQRIAKIFRTNRSQAVRLPKDFQFAVAEVFIEKRGDQIILSPRPASWADYLDHGPSAPADFMIGVDDMPVQERGTT
jgi:antitoxin VapB